MNQYRCETCKNAIKKPKSILPHCKICGMILTTIFKEEVISKIGCTHHSEFQSGTDMLKEKYRQLMAASINNENPGWVQIAEIEKILNPFGTIVPDIENLQEFPFRSNPKKDYKSCKQEEQK